MTNKLFLILIAGFVIYFLGRYFYMKPKFRNGEDIPAFSAILKDGKTFELSSLQGQFVLLDFWGSWCGPCRKENPELVELYQKHKNSSFKKASGFEIVSVGVESNVLSWENAINADNLIWPYHILQKDRFQSPIVKQFGVREIPTKYLLNEKGQIIAVNPTVKLVDKLLNDRLLADN